MRRPFLFGLLLLAACSTNSVIEQSARYADLGDHERAFRVLDEARTERLAAGSDPTAELDAAWASARRRNLLEQARWDIFSERETDALARLAELEEIAPDYPELAVLRERAIRKLALRAVKEGDDLLLRKDLEGALASYLRAESIEPGFPPAVEGSENVRVALGELSAKAQRQFLEAVRKLPEFRFVEVRWHSEIALANAPERADAEKLHVRAQKELAQKALERGRECLDADQYGAALLEFRTAQKLDPDLAGVDERIAEVEREIRAATLMEKAQISMRSGRFTLAREQLDEAFQTSTLSRGGISELMMQARRLEGEANYRAARDLEILGKKAEALAAFEELAKAWPEGLEDEQARIDGLRLDVDTAATEWAAAEAAEQAGDLPGALLHYETAMQFYPGWKDGDERIERLKQKVAEQTPPADDGGEAK